MRHFILANLLGFFLMTSAQADSVDHERIDCVGFIIVVGTTTQELSTHCQLQPFYKSLHKRKPLTASSQNLEQDIFEKWMFNKDGLDIHVLIKNGVVLRLFSLSHNK